MSGEWSSPDGGGLIPPSIAGPLERYRAALDRVAGRQVEAVYAVGSIALGDWSERQSNVDLVVVATPHLAPDQRDRLVGVEKALERGGRRSEIWYATWDQIAGSPDLSPGDRSTSTPGGSTPAAPSSPADRPAAPSSPADHRPSGPSSADGGPGGPSAADSRPAGPSSASPSPAHPRSAHPSPPAAGPGGRTGDDPDEPLATPLTTGILRQDPVAVHGPDWPVVGFEPDALRAWALARLRSLVESSHGLLVMRRAVVPMVLEAARLAQVVTTGRVTSKSAAGEATIPQVTAPHRRILTDSVGYRRGAQTSMYWGPFERKYDALALLRELLELASPAKPSPGPRS